MKTADQVLTEVINRSPYKTKFAITRVYVIQAMEDYKSQSPELDKAEIELIQEILKRELNHRKPKADLIVIFNLLNKLKTIDLL